MKFESHGKFTIWTEKSTVFAECIGSWNVESALLFELEFKKIASTMPEQWAHIVYLNDWELCVPEMLVVIERLVTWCINNGLVRAANVYQASHIKSEIINRMVINKQGGFERVVFNNASDAGRWLSEQGFPTSCDEY